MTIPSVIIRAACITALASPVASDQMFASARPSPSGKAGADFVFQSVEPHQIAGPDGTLGFYAGHISPPMKTFAFWILPSILFFSSLMAVTYHVGLMQQVVRGMAAAVRLGPDRYLEVRFEDLLTRSRAVLSQVARHLDLPVDDAFLDRGVALVRGSGTERFPALTAAEQAELREAVRPGQLLLGRDGCG